MHYNTRANVYMLLGWGLVGSCFGVHFCPYLGGWGVFSHVCKSSAVALVFGFGMDSCQNSVILNHCVKHGFLVRMSFNVGVGGNRAVLTDFIGILVSRIGGGSGVGFSPFVVYPPSCQGGRYHMTEQFMWVSILLVLFVLFRGHVSTLFQIFYYFLTFACH